MQNININGHGKFSGGEYGEIIVNGSANCAENVVCLNMAVNGHLSAGSVTADSVGVNGHLSVSGSLNAKDTDIDGAVSVSESLSTDRLDVDGHLSVTGSLNAGDTSVDGHLSCNGSANTGDFDCDGIASLSDGLRAKSVEVDGMLNVTGNVEAERVHADGKISATGQICADQIHIFGIVRADEIVGDDIEIDFKDPISIMAGFVNSVFGSRLQNDVKCANLIEATTIKLRGVCAGVVSGEHVAIGENCRIDQLDCTGDFTIDPTSTIRMLNDQPYNG